jgi:hypothetical protein
MNKMDIAVSKVEPPIYKVLTALILLLLSTVYFLSAELPEHRLKSLIIRQIADRQIIWPPEAGMDNRDKPFVMGLVGDGAFVRYLEQEYSSKQPARIKNKTVLTRKVKQVEQIPGCDLLFVSDLPVRLFARMVESIQDKPVLTLTDTKDYIKEGIQISFVLEKPPDTPVESQELIDQQIPKIIINETAVKLAGLSIRKDLLARANIIQPFKPYLDIALLLAPITTFVTWPPTAKMDDPSKPFIITVIGDNYFNSYLDNTYKEKELKNKPVTIRYISNIKEINDTHLLFISKSMKNKISEILAYTKNKPILTVGDTKGFSQAGVHINFFYQRLELHFEINNEAARTVGLNLSYHLLKQAKTDISY